MSGPASPDLLRTFSEELHERAADLERALLSLERAAAPAERAALVGQLFRAVHSVKGAAHAVGATAVESLAHELESRLLPARDAAGPLDAELVQRLLDAVDVLRVTAGQLVPAVAAVPAPGGAERSEAEPVRIDAAVLDAILARWTEAGVERRRLGARVAAFADALDLLEDWRTEWRGHRGGLRRAGPEAAVAVRLVDERLGALATLAGDRVAAAREAVRELDRSSGALDTELRGARQRPFADACDGLERVVRDLAKAEGKDVRLRVAGDDVLLDRAVVAQLRDLLRHLVRNAVDHGVETSAARLARGKPATATVEVAASVEGDRVAIAVRDDGAGFDEDAIRARAAERGVVAPPDRADLARLVLMPGFSTRSTATTVSGRGVGLDVVRSAVESLQGTVDIVWERGRGSACTLRLPLSLATTHAVLVRVQGVLFALPTADVRRCERANAAALATVAGRPALVRAGGPAVPVVDLGALLGLGPAPERAVMPLVLLSSAGREVALVVDEVVAEAELPVRGLGGRLHGLRLVAGAATLESGEVVLLLHTPALIRAASEMPAEAAVERGPGADAPRRRVLVADDSATTRGLLRSILESAGYDVATAVDGADAWTKIDERVPDLVVSDVDMPRMDGVALCEAIRRSPRSRSLPVILVTGLGSERDRARGLDAGADAYVVKSEFDQSGLLDLIARVLA